VAVANSKENSTKERVDDLRKGKLGDVGLAG